jgi:hypothetical protein
VKITAPVGYDEIVPLQKTHRVLRAGATPAFCRALSAIAISLAEFPVAGRDYPIVFATLDNAKTFAPVVVLGFEAGHNLFVDDAGQWAAEAYLPAFVRRYPFCISKLYVDGEPRSERVVCVAKAWIDEGGIALFDAQGRPTAQWQATERLLSEYEADLDRTAQLSAALARLQLLEPFSVQRMGSGSAELRLGGMYRVGEEKLKDLKPASHKALAAKGFTGLIHAHLHSLPNFSRLAARLSRAAPRPTTDARG